ncbi:microtubule-associated proteins 1A/1B light chain 3C-like [Chrysoperla carnea]|uniref:microtubule-associated proteins 1A/1B light chain 3C-like n=1 Tax=Chrysoperla carnea TaxID=189513 RepID=UPI001D073B24|nr:microtubule-associated proteins 1A/1B light chain 3C-like [Chrysoperla carnea]
MYSNTTLLSICQCFDSNTNKVKENSNNNLCLLKFNNNNNEMETRRHYPDKTRRDVNFNHNIKQKQSFDKRKAETYALRCKFPTKVPIMVTRYAKEKNLPHLDKSKYLVPQEITLSQFITIIRHRMQLRPTEALYLLVNDRSMLSLSCTLAEAYQEYQEKDGFLYITYASQAVFGCNEEKSTTHPKSTAKTKK